MAQSISSQQVQNATFSTTRLRPGYEMKEVDEFLENVAQRMSAGLPPMSPRHIPEFNTTRLRRGYDEEEVDAFLDILYEASGIAPPEL